MWECTHRQYQNQVDSNRPTTIANRWASAESPKKAAVAHAKLIGIPFSSRVIS